jgi:hypothetical protein
MQQVSFDNADEKAIGGSVAYDFGHAFGQYGLPGFIYRWRFAKTETV